VSTENDKKSGKLSEEEVEKLYTDFMEGSQNEKSGTNDPAAPKNMRSNQSEWVFRIPKPNFNLWRFNYWLSNILRSKKSRTSDFWASDFTKGVCTTLALISFVALAVFIVGLLKDDSPKDRADILERLKNENLGNRPHPFEYDPYAGTGPSAEQLKQEEVNKEYDRWWRAANRGRFKVEAK
jgi:hypothetical protein